jgi:hypothetical protein
MLKQPTTPQTAPIQRARQRPRVLKVRIYSFSPNSDAESHPGQGRPNKLQPPAPVAFPGTMVCSSSSSGLRPPARGMPATMCSPAHLSSAIEQILNEPDFVYSENGLGASRHQTPVDAQRGGKGTGKRTAGDAESSFSSRRPLRTIYNSVSTPSAAATRPTSPVPDPSSSARAPAREVARKDLRSRVARQQIST